MRAPAALHAADLPGRVCPADYRYPVTVFDRAADFSAETLYVVGGLYGNAEALAAVEAMAAREATTPTIVFNGDFHWFDAEPAWFDAVEAGVSRHLALRGNVESEIARPQDIGAGCGCAYPADVDAGTVERSNRILGELRAVAQQNPAAVARLATLPMHRVAAVGSARIGIVHGDAAALAGWGFAQDALDSPSAPARIESLARASRIDVFASTHTCLAALRQFARPGGAALTVVNNGAAGMPNFRGDRRGLISRIALTPSPHAALYGLRHRDLYVDALPLAYDWDTFFANFSRRWPSGSAAAESYGQRIRSGPNYPVEPAMPRPPDT